LDKCEDIHKQTKRT